MFTEYPQSSLITAIAPETCVHETIASLNEAGHDVMNWSARGSLKDTRWYRKLLPAFCPEKGVLRIIVDNREVDSIMQTIVQCARLDRKATGAVFASPLQSLSIGGLFHTSCKPCNEQGISQSSAVENLDVIYCIVEKNKADGIARAAINAGAHGPVVHYGEGRGLRDRLGWLRITKQQEKEVLTVITEKHRADKLFDAMATAGQIDKPGGGFMYQLPIEKGLYNLPSYYEGNRGRADMQQVISAIDHLMGHEDWRDRSMFARNNATRSAGLSFLEPSASTWANEQQICVTAIVDREHEEQLSSMMLNAGALGVSVNYSQLHTADDKSLHNDVKLVNEYGILRTVVSEEIANSVMAQLKLHASDAGIEDACLFSQSVSRVLTYRHYPRPEKRRNARERQVA